MAHYEQIPRLRRFDDIFQWFQKLEGFPKLCSVAKILHSIPATSVSSERLFSTATRLYADKCRSRLSAERAEQILLIKSSLKCLKLAPEVDISIIEEDDEKQC